MARERKRTEQFNYNSKDKNVLPIRTIPFGPPKTRDNETHNPGRMRYGSNQSTSYADWNGMNFTVLDLLTIEQGENVQPKLPEWVTVNGETPWRSGHLVVL